MAGISPIVLVALSVVVFFVYRANKDKRVLQAVAGALITEAQLREAQGHQREADELRDQWHALLRAQATVAARPRLPIEESERQALLSLTDPRQLEHLMARYGSHHEAYESLMRLARQVEKTRVTR